MDFGSNSIEIRRNSDSWGPFSFVLTDMLPTGVRISSVMATVYIGNLKPSSDISDFSTLSSLIESGTLVTSNQTVQMKFQYPGDDHKGDKCTIVITVTLSSNAKNQFHFYPVKVV